MRKTLALVLAFALVLASLSTPAAAQWKPEIKFIKIGVSTAGGDWFRAGAKFSTLDPGGPARGGGDHRSWAAAWST